MPVVPFSPKPAASAQSPPPPDPIYLSDAAAMIQKERSTEKPNAQPAPLPAGPRATPLR